MKWTGSSEAGDRDEPAHPPLVEVAKVQGRLVVIFDIEGGNAVAENPGLIFSHSNPSAVYPHVRNISDDLMRACAQTGGVVHVNGLGMFLGKDANGRPDNSTEALIRHIDYAAQLIGPEHAGLGLDYVWDMSELEELVSKHARAFRARERISADYAGNIAMPRPAKKRAKRSGSSSTYSCVETSSPDGL